MSAKSRSWTFLRCIRSWLRLVFDVHWFNFELQAGLLFRWLLIGRFSLAFFLRALCLYLWRLWIR